MTDKTSGQSIKEKFIFWIEQQILSGELGIGQRLPPEREIAQKSGISRTIVHTGIAELVAKNVLSVIPRKGTFVNDFKKEPTIELYNTLLKYTGKLDESFIKSLTVYREIVETANAGLAAENRTPADIANLKDTVAKERFALSVKEKVELDYLFHLQIAMATGNIVLPMAVRSTEDMYRSLLHRFYERAGDLKDMYAMHEKIIFAIETGDRAESQRCMKYMLDEGARILMEDVKSGK